MKMKILKYLKLDKIKTHFKYFEWSEDYTQSVKEKERNIEGDVRIFE